MKVTEKGEGKPMNEHFRKFLTGAAIAVAGAILTYVEMTLIPDLKQNHVEWAPVLTAINSTLIQAARKYLQSVQDGGKQDA